MRSFINAQLNPRRRDRRAGGIVFAALTCFALVGCSDGRPERVPVSGQVLIDGQPLKFGYVRFVPNGARAAGGDLDADGRFTLTCYESGDGTVVGPQTIEVAAAEPLGPTRLRWHAPKKYADFRTSGLEQTIDGPTDSVVIELSWHGGKPFDEGPQAPSTGPEMPSAVHAPE